MDELGNKASFPKSVEAAAASGMNKEDIVQWRTRMEATGLHLTPPALIGAIDETMIAYAEKKVKVFTRKDTKAVKRLQKTGLPHMTLVPAVFADGAACKPLLILPLQTLPRSLESMLEFFYIAGSDKGWMTKEVWTGYMDYVIGFINERRQKFRMAENSQSWLIVDGHSSRGSVEALKKLKAAHVEMSTIPSDSGAVLDPLDCGINGALKQKLASAITANRRELKKIEDVDGQRFALVKLLLTPLQETLIQQRIRACFMRTGISPWDLTPVLSNPLVSNLAPPRNPDAGRGLNISGRTISDVKFIEEMEAREKEREEEQRVKEEKRRARELKKTNKETARNGRKKRKAETDEPPLNGGASRSKKKARKERVRDEEELAALEGHSGDEFNPLSK